MYHFQKVWLRRYALKRRNLSSATKISNFLNSGFNVDGKGNSLLEDFDLGIAIFNS